MRHNEGSAAFVRRPRTFREAVGALVVAAAVTAGIAVASGQTAHASATGTLELRTSLPLLSNLGSCPPGVAADACAARTGAALFPGLGRVTATYTWSFRMGPPTCPAELGKPLATTGRLVVAGKGEIQFSVAEELVASIESR